MYTYILKQQKRLLPSFLSQTTSALQTGILHVGFNSYQQFITKYPYDIALNLSQTRFSFKTLVRRLLKHKCGSINS